jgi:hypothetical protein
MRNHGQPRSGGSPTSGLDERSTTYHFKMKLLTQSTKFIKESDVTMLLKIWVPLKKAHFITTRFSAAQ